MNIKIDVDNLRDDLRDYYGSAVGCNPTAMTDVINVDSMSDEDVVEKAVENGFNLYDYEV